MNTTERSHQTAHSCELLIDDVISVLGSFLRATDELTGAINDRNGAGMCDALDRLGRARVRALALVGREPVVP
ncbi:MAG TPA: hypothetical protein VFV02_16815 [Acidimicrobiales bacterium]|nr:hypothetical protein [Acidimicrobiales bacterium]